MKDKFDLQVIFDGWHWLQNAVLNIIQRHRGGESSAQELAQIAHEVVILLVVGIMLSSSFCSYF